MSTRNRTAAMDVTASEEQKESTLFAEPQQHDTLDQFRKYKIFKHSCLVMTNFAMVSLIIQCIQFDRSCYY